jgi:hypothetical protein
VILQETSRYDELERESQRLQQDINQLLYQKQRQAEVLARKSLLAKQYQDLERGVSRPVNPKASRQIQDEHKGATKRLADVRQILKAVKSQFPHLEAVLDPILVLSNDIQSE